MALVCCKSDKSELDLLSSDSLGIKAFGEEIHECVLNLLIRSRKGQFKLGSHQVNFPLSWGACGHSSLDLYEVENVM